VYPCAVCRSGLLVVSQKRVTMLRPRMHRPTATRQRRQRPTRPGSMMLALPRQSRLSGSRGRSDSPTLASCPRWVARICSGPGTPLLKFGVNSRRPSSSSPTCRSRSTTPASAPSFPTSTSRSNPLASSPNPTTATRRAHLDPRVSVSSKWRTRSSRRLRLKNCRVTRWERGS
jgi:hypothetical protein